MRRADCGKDVAPPKTVAIARSCRQRVLDILEHRLHRAGVTLQNRDIDIVEAADGAVGVDLHGGVTAGLLKLDEMPFLAAIAEIVIQQRREVELSPSLKL